jgi:hypothetical protein
VAIGVLIPHGDRSVQPHAGATMSHPPTHTSDPGTGPGLGPAAGADSQVVTAAEHEMRSLDPSIFNHTMRVLHLARHLPSPRPAPDREALAVAVLFHDSGTIEENNGDQRFEVEGADAAARFLAQWDWSPERIRPVWEAIALHTSPGIAERFGPLARLLRAAVLVDLGRAELPVSSTSELDAQLARYARLDIDRVLPEAVVAQALDRDGNAKAPPYSWPGVLLAERLAHNAQGQ